MSRKIITEPADVTGADQHIIRHIRRFLADNDELLNDTQYIHHDHPLAGHCYVASEVFYHIKGGRESRLTPCYVEHEDTTHWFLREDGRIIDLTREQFADCPPYQNGAGCGFQNTPSKRTQQVLENLAEMSELVSKHV